MEEVPAKKKPIIFMGRDLSKVPCLRTTLLYSFSSALGVTMVSFLATSNGTRASIHGLAAMWLVTLTYMPYCKYQVVKHAEKMKIQQELVRRHNQHPDFGSAVDVESDH